MKKITDELYKWNEEHEGRNLMAEYEAWKINNPILSILIPTTPDREKVLYELLSELHNQIEKGGYDSFVEIRVEPDDGKLSVGKKRQVLLEKAKGKYVVFIDSDDKVSDNSLSELLQAASQEPDVISFNGWMETNGANRENFKISKDFPYITVSDAYGKKEYLRYPNHLCAILRAIAIKIGYKDMRHAEDYDFAKRLKESGLLKKEVYIQKDLYYYLYNSKK